MDAKEKNTWRVGISIGTTSSNELNYLIIGVLWVDEMFVLDKDAMKFMLDFFLNNIFDDKAKNP
jgi:hypothetical protein